MKTFMENWPLIVVGLGGAGVIWLAIKNWLSKPRAQQIANIKEWLLGAVAEAEKQLGGGTGQLKLRYVYDKAIQRFPWLSVVPFETFKGWVDGALDEMKKQLGENDKIKAYVEG